MTFIDTITDKTNTGIVVSDAKGDQEARDDLRVGFGSVQKRDHVVAGIVGSDNKPPTSAPRDSIKSSHAAVCHASVRHIVVIPKGKIYTQLVLDSFTGVVWSGLGSVSAQLASYKRR